MTKHEVIQIIIYILGSSGFLGGIYMLLKLRPEAGQITVTAAQGAIIVQTGVIDTLRAEIKRMEERFDEQEQRLKDLQEENNQLRARLRDLERIKQ